MRERFRTYTLRIEAVDGAALGADELDTLNDGIQDAEDVVNDRLPEGFYCKIDEADEGEHRGLAAARRLSDEWSR